MRAEYALIIIPLKYLPVGTLIALEGYQFENVLRDLRHWNRETEVNALQALSNAFNSGYAVKQMGVDIANATFLLVRGEADTLLYGQ